MSWRQEKNDANQASGKIKKSQNRNRNETSTEKKRNTANMK